MRTAAWRVKMARVGAGLGLGLTCVLVATVWLLHPRTHDVFVVGVLAVAQLAATLGPLTFLPWQRVSDRALLLFPALGLLGMALLGVSTTGIASNYGAFIVTSFLYVGLTQRPGTSLLMVPAAVPSFIAMYGGVTNEVLVRLPIALAVWVLVGEVTARRSFADATEMGHLERVAVRDELTGLFNRRALPPKLDHLRSGDALMLLDIDHFKRINDAHGHQAGDEVLSAIGALIAATARAIDSAVRYGGEEFLILLPGAGAPGAHSFDVRLRAEMASALPGVTYSAGVAVLDGEESPWTAVRRADDRLYAAKNGGRDRTEGVAGISPSAAA